MTFQLQIDKKLFPFHIIYIGMNRLKKSRKVCVGKAATNGKKLPAHLADSSDVCISVK